MSRLLNRLQEHTKKKARNDPSLSSEYERYVNSDFVTLLDNSVFETFDLLGFWKAKELMFPVLSRMTMDIISVQATLVASESALSTSGRVNPKNKTHSDIFRDVDNKCTVEFDAFSLSVKDFFTHHILLRCDSSGDIYPVTSPSPTPHALLSMSPSTWHQHLGHPGEDVLRSLMSQPNSTLFSIKLHYGGVFTISPNRKYNNGNITFVDLINSDQFSVNEIDSMLEDLGENGHRVMFYHFLKPGCDLDNGLEPLACDKDVVLLGITPVAKKLVLDVNNKQTSGKDLERKSSRKDLEGKSSGKDLEGQSSAVGNDGSSHIGIMKSEEEVEVEDESDSEDSDYLVDEGNNVDDVDVDMEDFKYNIDEEVEFVGCRDREKEPDIEEGDVKEIEVGVIPSLPTFEDLSNGPSQGSGPSQDLVEQLKTNPKIPVRALQEQLQQKHELSVTQSKAFRAKQAAKKKLMGDYTLQYNMLMDYVLKLQESNSNTTIKIHAQSEANHEAARSATSTDKGKAPTGSQLKDKGKAPTVTTGVSKKTSSKKKIINLG
nr:ribonuclease H-like domain-containing protein [Tanacetum cinerariifolium]